MGRPLKNPDYDHDKLMNEILDEVVKAYMSIENDQYGAGDLTYGSLKDLSEELQLKPLLAPGINRHSEPG